MAKNKNNITTFKRRIIPNISIVFFILILIYVVTFVVLSSKEEKIVGYQVKTGVLSDNRQYNGIALRDEHMVYSKDSGYIYYLIRENERVGYNSYVYCIDETGKFSDLISKDPTQDNSLTSEELSEIKQDIIEFSRTFDQTVFSDVTGFTNRLDNTIKQIENRKILEDMSALDSKHINDILKNFKAKASGIVLFYEDGYEEKKAADLAPADFDESKYNRKSVMNDNLVATEDFVFKYINDENWSIALCVPNEDSPRILKNDYVKVRFVNDNVYSWGKVNGVNIFDDYTIIELSFTNSMVSFASDRFVKVELILEEDQGLKIPISSIVEKEFYLIDSNFVYQDQNSSDYYVYIREYGENSVYAKKHTIKVLKEDNEENVCYVDKTSITYGETLFKKDSPVEGPNVETYIVGGFRVGTLEGVYCINKGYADFKRIVKKYENEEYAIISNNSALGLRAYDYIALDASKVSDKDFVY